MNATSALHESARSLADSQAQVARVTAEAVKQIAEVSMEALMQIVVVISQSLCLILCRGRVSHYPTLLLVSK